MRHAPFLTLLALTLVGCEQPPTAVAPARTPAFLTAADTGGGGGGGGGNGGGNSISIPIDLIVFVPCAAGGSGEVIEVSGPLHVVQNLTISASGNVSDYFHFQPQGISGTGFTTGAKYQGTGITQFKDQFNGLPFSSSTENTFNMIGQGPGNNFKVHENFHFTVNANGVLTAFLDNFSVTCK